VEVEFFSSLSFFFCSRLLEGARRGRGNCFLFLSFFLLELVDWRAFCASVKGRRAARARSRNAEVEVEFFSSSSSIAPHFVREAERRVFSLSPRSSLARSCILSRSLVHTRTRVLPPCRRQRARWGDAWRKNETKKRKKRSIFDLPLEETKNGRLIFPCIPPCCAVFPAPISCIDLDHVVKLTQKLREGEADVVLLTKKCLEKPPKKNNYPAPDAGLSPPAAGPAAGRQWLAHGRQHPALEGRDLRSRGHAVGRRCVDDGKRWKREMEEREMAKRRQRQGRGEEAFFFQP